MSRRTYTHPEPSRPDYRPAQPGGKAHRWTQETPVSTRNRRRSQDMDQELEQAERTRTARNHAEQRSRAVRERPLTAQELEQIQIQSQAGIVRTVEDQRIHREAHRRLARWSPPKAEAVAERWMDKGPGRRRPHS